MSFKKRDATVSVSKTTITRPIMVLICRMRFKKKKKSQILNYTHHCNGIFSLCLNILFTCFENAPGKISF